MRIELRLGHLVEGAADQDAGVVDHDVEAAQPRDRFPDQAAGVGGARHVAHEAQGPDAAALEARTVSSRSAGRASR